ncbi:type VI secretion protein [Streptomyces sp. NPDC006326]|uniref:type VI secretion protein n=1 Tax=Streptomyces sp. NPDC006326 TaxID=3156752 RepID=UPI0033B09B29
MHEERRAGGIPDGLLVGLLAFLLGLAVLVWSSTGLAALFSRGSWPATVTFTRTPGAIRALIAQPHDIPGAWPDTAPTALSGWGLFWGLFIGQLLILLVLVIFTLGVIARTKARAKTRSTLPEQSAQEPVPVGRPAHGNLPGQGTRPAHEGWRSPEPQPAHEAQPTYQAQPTHQSRRAHQSRPLPETPGVHYAQQVTTAPPGPPPEQSDAAQPARADEAYRYGFGYAPATTAYPAAPSAHDRRLVYADPADRHRAAARRLADAPAAALVVTSSPTLWEQTKDARAKLGPVLLYDPSHLCDTPARMHWNPAHDCADRDTAAARATALLAPVQPQARMDAAITDTAETLLRSWLQAVALEDRPFKQLHRWAQGTGAQDPVRILRTHPQAAAGAAGELESALTAHPERREQAQQLTARTLSCLTSVHIREACNPNRTDALTLASFVAEGGTLYVVGEPLEDPRTHPGAMPLLTALVSSVVEHGRRMAGRSSHGRLDPPLTLVLDDIAAVAPIPQLPELLLDETLPLLALCRSREQARARWPEAALP